MIDQQQAAAFLACGRIALVGASDNPKNFGGQVRKALVDQGIDVVAVHPTATTVGGQPAYASLTEVPGQVDGVLVMITGDAVLDVIRAAHDRSCPKVWLFKGIGAPGASSDEAVQLCAELGLDVVAGACPLMFLQPVGAVHRIHRFFRKLNGSVGKAA
jgi:predicted CoA-binding protein